MLAILCLFAPAASSAERVPCPITADTWISMPPWQSRQGDSTEGAHNRGASPQLILRGRESFALLRFDCAGARGRTVTRATLRVHRQPDPVPLHTVGISTVSGNGPWEEGTQTEGPSTGGATFFFARAPQQAWSYPKSELVDVTFAQGGSLYAYPRATDAGGDWWEIDVPPALVHAVTSGDQYGWMLTDEKGQTQTRHILSSREGPHPPQLIVETAGRDQTAPAAPRLLPGPGRPLHPGRIALRFGGAGDDGGQGVATRYELRYSRTPIDPAGFEQATPVPRWMMSPLAAKATPLQRDNALADEVTAVVEQLQPGAAYHFAARARDEAGNAGPVALLGQFTAFSREYPALPPAVGPARSGKQPNPEPRVWAVPELLKIHPRTGDLLEQNDAPEHRLHNALWDAASGTVRLSGARNEFVAFQLAIESPTPLPGIEVRITRPLFADNKLPAVFAGTGATQLYREWFVPDEKNEWYPDALIPLTGALDLPAKDNPVPGQRVQPVFVDVFIPHDARPGTHRGALSVRGPGLRRDITVEVEVLPLTLPDTLNFIVDLNAYSGVSSGYPAQRGTPEYRAIERGYYRVAHLNRGNLDILGYGHNGGTVPDHAPPITGQGASARVADWKDWDAHFGPLVDGSAFADLPRASVPVAALYLPFFENWPGDLRKSYRFDTTQIARTMEEYQQLITTHALTSAPVEESFDEEYQQRVTAIARDFARHILERGWLRPAYYVYFNNKYYYKRPTQGGRGISWWLMDEPNHRDDIRAASFLAHRIKLGTGQFPNVPILYRGDISRVDWIRDLMPGQIDLLCVSSRFYQKNRYLREDPYRFGRILWNYASTNHPRDTNVAMRAWCWRAWLAGADGIVPWNTVRGPEAWDRAEPLTVFYAPSKFGAREPFASLRLKAFRRGQQDMEYLMLLAGRPGWDREAVSRAVAASVHLAGAVSQAYEDDAGSMRFTNLRDSEFDTLRMRVARALLEK